MRLLWTHKMVVYLTLATLVAPTPAFAGSFNIRESGTNKIRSKKVLAMKVGGGLAMATLAGVAVLAQRHALPVLHATTSGVPGGALASTAIAVAALAAGYIPYKGAKRFHKEYKTHLMGLSSREIAQAIQDYAKSQKKKSSLSRRYKTQESYIKALLTQNLNAICKSDGSGFDEYDPKATVIQERGTNWLTTKDQLSAYNADGKKELYDLVNGRKHLIVKGDLVCKRSDEEVEVQPRYSSSSKTRNTSVSLQKLIGQSSSKSGDDAQLGNRSISQRNTKPVLAQGYEEQSNHSSYGFADAAR